ncbi:hypothetical protein V6N13_010858 [Hibiscus sabdariffa]|uniref:Uncharacterized protein n=1 Tax=Hibiscus sabdariffa TaxID=183260 RepID=A0ABR2SAF7_9ROSI
MTMASYEKHMLDEVFLVKTGNGVSLVRSDATLLPMPVPMPMGMEPRGWLINLPAKGLEIGLSGTRG